MNFRTVTLNDLVILTLDGDVELIDWRCCFTQMETMFIHNGFKRLLIDGTRLRAFNISNDQCRLIAPGFAGYSERTAFFSADPLIFGMMRVVHSYAFNDQFRVFKTRDEASEFIADTKGAYQPA